MREKSLKKIKSNLLIRYIQIIPVDAHKNKEHKKL